MTQPGETDGYDVGQHLKAVAQYAPQIRFDYLILNSRAISGEQAEHYRADGAYQVGVEEDVDPIAFSETEVVRADLLADGEMVRHDSARLARVVVACSEKAHSRVGTAVES